MKKISRREFLIGGAVLAAGAFSGCLGDNSVYRGAKESLNILNDGSIRFVRQIVGNSPDNRIMAFEAEKELTNAAVELKYDNGAVSSVKADYVPFTDDNVLRRQYEAHITGLVPGKSYEYRINSDDGASEWIKFKVADDDKLNALIFPDSQSSDYSGWGKLAQSAYLNNNDADLFVNMGDIVDNGEDYTQWEAWFQALNGIEEHIPCSPILGNHECYDKNWKVRLPDAYINYFPLPNNGSENFERYYYAYDIGPCRFIALTTEWDEINDYKRGLLEEEKHWLENVAGKTDKPWKIVMMHRDVLQYRIKSRPERKEGFSEAGEVFMPIFEKLNIDIVFSAHLHSYRNRGILKNRKKAKSGPYYILTGVAGDVRYPNLWVNHALDDIIAPQPETANYLTMRMTKDTVNIKCYRDDGKILDDVNIKKG